MLGRAASNLYTFRGIASTVGTLLIPMAVEKMGLQGSYFLFGCIMALAAISIYALLPQVRGFGVP